LEGLVVPLSNAERQKRWRDKRNALAKRAEKMIAKADTNDNEPPLRNARTAEIDGQWVFSYGRPRSHFHLFCSEKGNHAGYPRRDSDQMKFYGDQLPDELVEAMNAAS
jgi:hypothetical protein